MYICIYINKYIYMHITPRRHANGSAWCAPGRCRYSATRASELRREPPTGDGDHATIHMYFHR